MHANLASNAVTSAATVCFQCTTTCCLPLSFVYPSGELALPNGIALGDGENQAVQEGNRREEGRREVQGQARRERQKGVETSMTAPTPCRSGRGDYALLLTVGCLDPAIGCSVSVCHVSKSCVTDPCEIGGSSGITVIGCLMEVALSAKSRQHVALTRDSRRGLSMWILQDRLPCHLARSWQQESHPTSVESALST